MNKNMLIVAVLLIILPSWVSAQDFGLATRPSFSAFHGERLPPNAATVSGNWSVEVAFPQLTFLNPMGITPMPGTNRLVVWEREGRVYFFEKQANTSSKTLMLDIHTRVQGWDDSGLMALAFHPQFEKNRFVFLYYTYVTPGTVQGDMNNRPPTYVPTRDRLVRYTVNNNGTINSASETVFIDQLSDSVWHNGGGMFFHPENGFLYFTNGDDASKDPQTIENGLHAGVFRIDVDRRGGQISHAPPRLPYPDGSVASHYFIPNDNPFVGQPNALEEFFCLGLRSPHRMTIDPVTQRIFIGDVGAGDREEISVIGAGQSGLNFQWSQIEGLNGKLTPPYVGTDTPPVLDYPHSGEGAIIGGYVYRGREFPELVGKYIFGDNISNNIYYLDESSTPVSRVYLCTLPFGPGPNSGNNYTGLSSFGLDADNELYLCQLSSLGGKIYKLARSGPPARQMPLTLSATGLFSDLDSLSPASGLIAYDVNTPLWSDGAHKQRWFGIPDGKQIGYAAEGEWTFPTGSVFVKHFDLPIDARDAALKTRLETRVMVRDDLGFVYGGSYRWRPNHSDADLVLEPKTVEIPVTDADGNAAVQPWFFPSRQDCLTCHTRASGGVLGLKSKQNNRNHDFGGVIDNQLRAWNHAGYFSPTLDEAALPNLTRLAAVDDNSASVEHRMRSYLDSNCSHCHRPGGVHTLWDARIETPLNDAGIVNGFVTNELGVAGAKVIVPADASASLMHRRMSTATEDYKMPPIGKNRVDAAAVSLLERWITEVKPPPASPLPSPWLNQDIGQPQIAGDASYRGGKYAIRGAGGDIWGTQDEFHFVYRELVGDGTIMARVLDQSETDGWAKAGLMIRESLAPGARHVMTIRAPGNGATFQGRETTDGESFTEGGTNPSMPIWLRIQRMGNVFISSSSQDGLVWNGLGRRTIRMSSRVWLGLCITSHNSGMAGSVSFDQVYFMPGVPYAFTEQPRNLLVRVGESAEFAAAMIGDAPSTFQWQRQKKVIRGENQLSYRIPSVTLAHAGSHQVIAGGKLASQSATLAVVGEAVYNPLVLANGTATLTVPTSGAGISWQWSKDGTPLASSSKISGSQTSNLVVRDFSAEDAGDYTCTARAFGYSEELGPYTLRLLKVPAVISEPPPAGVVSGNYSWQLSSSQSATSFIVRGLPKGLHLDARTNRIAGIPAVAGSFRIAITPRNAAGDGAEATFYINIAPLSESVLGEYAGLVERESAVNNELGGYIRVRVDSGGAISGRLYSAATSYSFKGRVLANVDADPTYSVTIKRGALAPLVLALNFERGDALLSGSVSCGSSRAMLAGRHAMVLPAKTPKASSLLTGAIKLDAESIADELVPQGIGSIRLSRTVSAGRTTISAAGTLADGQRFTCSSLLCDNAETHLRALLYRGKGSLQGRAEIQAVANHYELSGKLNWRKPVPLGFSANLEVNGTSAKP